MASTARQSNTLLARIAVVCAALLAGVVLQSASVRADRCDFIKYNPPRGWTVQNADEGRAYGRPDQTGVIMLQSRWFSHNVEIAFKDTWNELVHLIIPGAGQNFKPQVVQVGDYAIARGGMRVEIQGKNGVAMLTVIVGKGRKLGIAGIAKNDEALREIVAFTDAVTVEPELDSIPPASALVGGWWRAAGNHYYRYEFTARGVYSYSEPGRADQTGTYRVEGNRITLTGPTGHATSRTFGLTCVGGEVSLEFEAGRSYWAAPQRDCSSLRPRGC